MTLKSYSQVPNKRLSVYHFFQIFSDPPDLIRTPPFINFQKVGVFLNSLPLLLFFASTIHAHFQGQNKRAFAYILVACLMKTCFCFFSHFIIIFSRFSSSDPLYLDPPVYYISEFFLTPLFIRTLSPAYLALERINFTYILGIKQFHGNIRLQTALYNSHTSGF